MPRARARRYYAADLAYIHAAGFSAHGRAAGRALAALLRRAGIRRGTIVELGAGAGAATAALAAAGHRVHAIDASPAMIGLARRRVPGARFMVGRLPDVELPPCDAIVAAGEVLNYMAGRGAFDRIFRRAFRALRPGGLLVFDVVEPGAAGAGTVRARVGADWVVLAIAREDRARRRLERSIVSFRRVGRLYRRAHEIHRLTLLPARELVRRLRAAGFVARTARRYGAFSLPARHAVLLARKP